MLANCIRGMLMRFRKTSLLIAALLPLFAIVSRPTSAETLGTIEAIYNFHANYLAADPLRPFMYATTGTSLEIINSQSLAVVKSIPLDAGGKMSFSADGNRLYVAGGVSSNLHVFDANSQTLLNTIPVAGNNRVAAVVEGLDNRLFVQTLTHVIPNSRILQVDATTGASRGPNIFTIPYHNGDMQISPDRTTLYYGDSSAPASLFKIDVSTSTPNRLWRNTTEIAQNGKQIVLSHDGTMIAFVSGGGFPSYRIPVLSTADMSLQVVFPQTPDYPNALAFGPDDRWAFTLHASSSGTVNVFDMTTYANVGRFTVRAGASQIAVDRAGEHLFIAHNDSLTGNNKLFAYSTGIFVPEPSTYALATCALLPLVAIAIRRSRRRGRNFYAKRRLHRQPTRTSQ